LTCSEAVSYSVREGKGGRAVSLAATKIIVLPESWASRIAAGEVVERPASVVKELVENSLDAGAKEISVWVEGSGSSLIRVSDDGEGIPSRELPLALERHATSKLREEADLFRISTLGFRGEALPSIGSVSRLEIVSRCRQEEIGARLRVEGGKKGELGAAGSPVGTQVEIRDLFFNTPARRKFLKSPATELSHICDVINRMALAYDQVHFRLQHGTRVLCDYVATRRLEDRLQQVLGREITGGMIPFSWNGGKIQISGFLSTAPESFSQSRYLMTYVNGRSVRDRTLTHAVLQGYDTLLMKGRYPAAVVFLKIPHEEVDVNVHPAKYEVRFRRQTEVHEAMVEAVCEALKGEAKEPSVKKAGERISPFVVSEPAFSYETSIPFERPPSRTVSMTESSLASLDPAVGGFFSSLQVLGQILGCYLVCVSSRGMVLIDQHAAHERAAFERMRGQLQRGEIERQSLLIPQLIELPYGEAVLLEGNLNLINQLGFVVEGFGPRTFAIKAAPALLPPGDYRGIVREMVGEIAEIGQSSELRQELEARLMTLACHSVVRANRKLDPEEIQALLRELDQIDFATQCPHGRPVLLEFTREQLERMFKRV